MVQTPASVDPRERFRPKLEAYRARHAAEVTPEMLGLWERWMNAAWDVAQAHDPQRGEGFLEEEAAEERARLARKFLRGDGIEIGALHNPLAVPESAKVHYVDNHDTRALQLLYYEVTNYKFVEVEIIDDGETLRTIPDAS